MVALVLALLVPAPAAVLLLGSATIVLADDDDDDGRDDDDDDGGDDDDDDGPIRVRRAPVPVAPAPPPPVFAPDEIVALSLSDEDLATLVAQGFAVIEEISLTEFGETSRRLRIPGGTTLIAARDIVQALASGEAADFNHYYRSEQGFDGCSGASCPARRSIAWPVQSVRDTSCGRSATIGMIDTGINGDHETFAGAALDLRRMSPESFDPSGAVHGTAVAALLVGDPATRAAGLVPGARLVAIDAFHRRGSDERADIFTLIEALDTLATEEVGVINLSLAGPPNAVLEAVVERLVRDRNIVVVSAVGNGGPASEPAYPAAYAPVIAVTAVDRAGEVYRRAVRGDHVDLAAPGVDVWTAASISGARQKTGTSFAVPFVSAAAAILREAHPDLPAIEVAARLRDLARDLGEPGPDAIFGAGLVGLGALCDGARDG
ncbi:hypothetical protein OCH239_12330 [Roseivivax halodurans JCM 10272]|uniref:Peptidase S8/S53 domain-containing protein n=2 Tax=Roseivivax halodurans TaxID=93683 RepID=X7EDT6_9RHOB|nr:hypothetical protein OCH239_12330 [Roseivivax halodurans JCM 10272]